MPEPASRTRAAQRARLRYAISQQQGCEARTLRAVAFQLLGDFLLIELPVSGAFVR